MARYAKDRPIVAQTNRKRRPSADQWQSTKRVVAQTNRRPMVLRGYWFGKTNETYLLVNQLIQV